jgi:MFS family permease
MNFESICFLWFVSFNHIFISVILSTSSTALTALPRALRVLAGLVSDSYPIGGQRRKPYLTFGSVIFIAAAFVLFALDQPSLAQLAVLQPLMILGQMLAGSAADAIVIERSKYERGDGRGALQSIALLANGAANIAGTLCGTLLFNGAEWGWGLPFRALYAIVGILVGICVLPFLPRLVDEEGDFDIPSMGEQTAALWVFLQGDAVWRVSVAVCLVYAGTVYNSGAALESKLNAGSRGGMCR